MKSAIAVTYELDDAEAMAAELAVQIKDKLPLLKESVGILSAQPDTDVCTLSRRLSELLGFSVVGGTTAAATLFTHDGPVQFAVVLHVLTADDCLFGCAVSRPLEEGPQEAVLEAYRTAVGELRVKQAKAEPGAVFYISFADHNLPLEDQLGWLHNECGAVPIFGYVSADDFEFIEQKVYLNGVCAKNIAAVLVVSGNIKPVFEVKNLAGSENLSRKKVTRSQNSVIYEIDGKPAYDYLKSFDFIHSSDALWNYQFFVETQDEKDGDGVAVSRALHSYDAETGVVYCAAGIPENSYISLKRCEESDVTNSCRDALAEFAEKLRSAESEDYTYSTVFVASCSLRSMYLAQNKSAEGDLLKEMLPPGLIASGVYAFGEIAPTSIRDGKAANRFHNATFTLCAF